MSRKKVTVVGAGNVGASLAQAVALTNLADVVLIDIPETGGMPAGKGLDILEAGPVYGYSTRISGGTDWALAQGSHIVVVTAGVPRKPGMSRDDLLAINAKIVGEVGKKIKEWAPDSLVIVVSNPLDAMCTVIQRATSFPRERILGMAGVLDSARMKAFIAMEAGVSVENIDGFVLGGHGDTMVPLPRFTTISGIPLSEFLSPEKIQALMQRTRDGGAEIVKLLEKGSAYYAPAASVCEMISAILLDKKKILPCAVMLNGEYGVKGLFVGVLVRLGAGGMEKVIELKLNAEEEAGFKKSVKAVEDLVAALDKMK
ncbi:MAG: malate dehydrogenase [Elusimicrobia bacterium]|nr:malate dehydrogenase [Elusimicrobiota bacterium]